MAQEITQGLFSNLFETKIPSMGTQSSPFGGILQQQPITIGRGGMSPMSAITQRIMQSGEQLQGSVRGLFGQQTPEQAQKTAITQLIKNNPDLNLNEPEGLRRMAKQAMTVPGLEMFSIKLRQQADILEEKQRVAKRQAKKDLLTGISIDKYTPESVQTYTQTGNYSDLELIPKETSLTKLGVSDSGNLIFKTNDNKVVSLDSGKFVPFTGTVRREIAPEISKSVEATDKILGEKYVNQLESSYNALEKLAELTNIVESGVISGTLANGRREFLKALDTIGINTSIAENTDLSNSEAFETVAASLLGDILQQYGYNPSNVDLKAAAKRIPDLTRSTKGLNQILTILVKEKQKELKYAERAVNYLYENNTFKGFDFQRELEPLAPSFNKDLKPTPRKKQLENLSTDELRKRIESMREAR